MKFYAILAVIPLFTFAHTVEAPYTEIVAPQTQQGAPEVLIPKPPQSQSVRDYALSEAEKAGVPTEIVDYIIKNESGYNSLARGDQKILPDGRGRCTNKKSPLYGLPANARGLAAITECWYPEITDEQADDYRFAVEFLISQILKGEEHCRTQFSTCNDWYILSQ